MEEIRFRDGVPLHRRSLVCQALCGRSSLQATKTGQLKLFDVLPDNLSAIRLRVIASSTFDAVRYRIDSKTSGGASAYFRGSIEYEARPCEMPRT